MQKWKKMNNLMKDPKLIYTNVTKQKEKWAVTVKCEPS